MASPSGLRPAGCISAEEGRAGGGGGHPPKKSSGASQGASLHCTRTVRYFLDQVPPEEPPSTPLPKALTSQTLKNKAWAFLVGTRLAKNVQTCGLAIGSQPPAGND